MSLADLIAGVGLLVLVAFVWIARRAKPIGTHPYRWGTYLGLLTTAVGGGMALLTLIQPDVLSGLLIGTLSVFLLTAGVGILRHRRFGVIALLVTPLAWALVVVTHPVTASEPAVSTLAGTTLAGGWILTLPNVPYFRKRWQVMTDEGVPVAGQ